MNKKETLAEAQTLAMAITQAGRASSTSMQKDFDLDQDGLDVVFDLDQDDLDVVDSALNAAKAMTGARTEAEAIVAICETFLKAV